MKTHPLPVYLQRFFTERLATQLKASPNTIASYRDTFRLLLRYAAARLRRSPTELRVADIDADLVGLFLADIESTRGNSARSRNARLSAIRSFFKYVAVNEPQLLHHCQRILAMPPKRHEKRAIDYLSRAEIEALIAAPALSNWHGRRDRALLALALQTGLRVSELIGLSCGDIVLGAGAHVRSMGKGRKERATPIRKDSVKMLRDWLTERGGADADPVFVSNRNQRLSRDAVEQIVRRHVQAASVKCPSLKKKRVTPHVLRHSAAMQLLQNGVDRTVIALWLGHESVETTQMYIHADIQLKEKAMARTRPIKAPPGRYQPGDKLLAFLEAL
ncbi:tyrosine-type recombinase/integrase [Elioraea sp.]|uniref:tyrosine-type recombinase/integrase n=1 Tax=Elioraea sp. TaxID=2185103 RepID=UPI0025BA9111|nr:tyrosine-type recombinase/integrase [Elioraea sp.]